VPADAPGARQQVDVDRKVAATSATSRTILLSPGIVIEPLPCSMQHVRHRCRPQGRRGPVTYGRCAGGLTEQRATSEPDCDQREQHRAGFVVGQFELGLAPPED